MIDLVHRQMAVEATVRGREIDLRAVPYNQPTTVSDKVNGVYREQIHPDAFKQAKRRPNQVKLLRDHDWGQVLGSCVKINPRPVDALHVTARANTAVQLARDSLALAEAGDLHVSIGFIPDSGFDVWDDDRTMVTRHACELWEVSLVPFPAYDGADVLAVRWGAPLIDHAEPEVVEPDSEAEPVVEGTPNLDEVRAWLRGRSLTAAV